MFFHKLPSTLAGSGFLTQGDSQLPTKYEFVLVFLKPKFILFL